MIPGCTIDWKKEIDRTRINEIREDKRQGCIQLLKNVITYVRHNKINTTKYVKSKYNSTCIQC